MSRPPQHRRRNHALAWALSGVAHAAVLVAVLSARDDTPPLADARVMMISMVDLRDITPPPAAKPSDDPAPPKPPAAKPPPPRKLAKHLPPPEVVPVFVRKAPPSRTVTDPVETLIAMGMTSAEARSGGGGGAGGSGDGGSCDMVRRLQGELQKDGQVTLALAGRARDAQASRGLIPVWNGSWIRSSDQDGEGLAVIREAIIMRVFSAPEACRVAPMHGPVLIRVSHAAGASTIAVGARDWRWADLLMAAGAGSRRSAGL